MTRKIFQKDINRIVLADGRTVAQWKAIARHMCNNGIFSNHTEALDEFASKLYKVKSWAALTVKLKKENDMPHLGSRKQND